ncbi:MAG: glutaredoxin domain-containing protein [Acidobacteriota bacterium]|nr:glutaredoxin domain-containing protein [Acidobacteriota bacterium]
MELLMFTYPNCEKCEALKSHLKENGASYAEYDLTRPEGKTRIREFIREIRRDASGAVILPTLVALEEGRPPAVVTNPEEYDAWLKSRA